MTRGNLLVDTTPAGCWEDAFPVGNGRHGALVHGRPGAERVIVTHHDLTWPDAPAAAGPPDLAGRLPQLHTVPGRAGDLWLTGGDGVLYHATDGRMSFSAVTSVGTVATVGFGKAAPGARYPAIYLTGMVGGVQGIFRSTDGGAHWARINTGAQQWGWIGQAITGDPTVFGRVYLATNGRGIQYGDPLVSR